MYAPLPCRARFDDESPEQSPGVPGSTRGCDCVRGAKAHLVLRCFHTLAVVAVLGAATLTVTPAAAETATVTGSVHCNSDGTFTLTWTFANQVAQDLTITDASITGGGALVNLPIPIAARSAAPYPTAEAIQHGIATAHSATLTAHASWADGTTAEVRSSLQLPPECVQLPTKVSAPAPVVTVSRCTAGTSDGAASYRIPKVRGVAYLVRGEQVAPGHHLATDGSLVAVTAEALPGYSLDGRSRFTLAFTAITCAKPVGAEPPTGLRSWCVSGVSDRAASYVIPKVRGVRYQIEGSEVAAGKYRVADDTRLVVTAVAARGYRLTGPTTFSFSFDAPACALPAAAAVGAVSLADTGSRVRFQFVVLAGLTGLLGSVLIIAAGRRRADRRSPGS
jgi:hypothetical protein